MSPYLKSALILAAVVPLGALIGIVLAFQAIAATGSGGLGAVSGGLSEFLWLYVPLTALTWSVIYWRRRRAASKDKN